MFFELFKWNKYVCHSSEVADWTDHGVASIIWTLNFDNLREPLNSFSNRWKKIIPVFFFKLSIHRVEDPKMQKELNKIYSKQKCSTQP